MSLSGAAERLERSPEFELRAEGGEFFFVHRSGDKVVTDALGAAIWNALPGDKAGIAARVGETLNAPEELISGLAGLAAAAGIARPARLTADRPAERAAEPAAGSVSVVIVAYNSAADIRGCLDSVLAESPPAVEILVVDNASRDGTARIVAEEYGARGVRLIAPGRNLNFAGGVNLGLRRSSGDYVLVLNADTALEAGALGALAARMESVADAAAVVPMMKFFNLRGFINGIGNHIRNYGWGSDNFVGMIDLGQFAPLEEVPAACFGAVLLRRAALRDVGPLDRGYTAYYEDVDWSFRAWFRGWRIVPETRAVIYHKFGASFGAANRRKKRLIVRNRQRLALKLFQGRIRLGFIKRYLKEDLRDFFGSLRRRAPGAGSIAAAYLSLALRLPGILLKRRRVMGRKRPAIREATVIRKNPPCWSALDPRGRPQLSGHAFLTYYRAALLRPGGRSSRI